jgi:hypothetical protein
MSDQDNLFENQQPVDQQAAPEAEPQTQVQEDMFSDLLDTITDTEGNPKYADVPTALKSLSASQEHIRKLEQEAKEMREKLAKQEAADAIKEKVKSAPAEASVNEESLFDVVNRVLDARTKQQKEEENLLTVHAKFSEVYGEKASIRMKELAAQNEVSLQFLEQMAKTSPNALFKLSGISLTSRTPSHSRGSVNTEALSPQPPAERPKSIMNGATTSDVLAMWRWAGSQVTNQ